MFSKREGGEKQGEFWIESARVSKPKTEGFYSKLNEHLAAMDFARQVWALCAPAYCEESRGGRPGIDPVVYLKMLMVGFFENLRSERAIAARCEDSLSVRAFLGYGLEESTPDHSSLSVIRQRLGPEIYQGGFRNRALGAQSARASSWPAFGDRFQRDRSQCELAHSGASQYGASLLGVCEGIGGPRGRRPRRSGGGAPLR
jgi:Transposase domain (DUF772)